MRIWPGTPAPLGATFDGIGTNIAVFSEAAEAVEVCVFDHDGNEERLMLPERSGSVWHGYLPDLGAGAEYGLRVHGPWEPENGLRCNPNKLLLDPYARAIVGDITWGPEVFGHEWDEPNTMNTVDSAPYMPRSVVSNPFFDWGTDQPLHIPWSETIIYETHVKGATQLHPGVDEELRGTYAGIAHPAFIDHLVQLGVTTVELQPVHEFVHDSHLLERGLRNYWGYNSIGFFAPHQEYSHRHLAGQGTLGTQVQDFKQMVRTLHEAGIEVILDVVYNHTAEGNHLGPTLSMKGIDNPSYYRLVEDDKQYYMDYTGTGNTLNMRSPYVLQLVMDSLRYWATEMHVDGFRFDLASALARSLHEVDRLSAFFDLVQQDPVVSRLKLIAEPWDIGEGGYQVGNFPAQWAEWNGRYRDCVREQWAGGKTGLGEFAYRITGSSDLYQSAGRAPHASINFVTAHDGFTLRDLVSYHDKHNDANGEGNNDGESHNRSWNCGAEGPTDDEAVNELRARQQRNMLTTLLLSQGVPMLLGGDEFGRTQQGNNNAYCQDNDISWYHWDEADHDLQQFTAGVTAVRKAHPTFHRRTFFQGRDVHGTQPDLGWYLPDGNEMGEEDWGRLDQQTLALFISGEAIETSARGDLVTDDDFVWMINVGPEPVEFRLPEHLAGRSWELVVDTEQAIVSPATPITPFDGQEAVTVIAHAQLLLRAVRDA